MSSSICHSLYGTLPQSIPAGGLLHECCGFAFRHEPSIDPARMQSFRMYEFVLVGTPEESVAHRDRWLQIGLDSLPHSACRCAATRPTTRSSAGSAGCSRPTARRRAQVRGDHRPHRRQAHRDLLGELPRGPLRLPFEMRTPDGEIAHSACFGYGLERITLALFATHGLSTADWPGEVLTTLGS